MNTIHWLPDVLAEEDFKSFQEYIDSLYSIFRDDFVNAKPLLNGFQVGLPRGPLVDNRNAAFWHVISTDDKAAGCRLYDKERLKRVPWIRPIIENNLDESILIWSNIRRSGKRVDKRTLLWLKEEDYLIVLSNSKQKYILVTAYYTNSNRTRKKLMKEYEKSKN